MPLRSFHPAVARWFTERLGQPTAAQQQGWEAIRAGRHTLISAPTGSGKTLAAFLIELDLLLRESLAGDLPEETRVVYVSPLKALSADIHRNLAEPRREIRRLAEEMGFGTPKITAAVRSGDTPAAERAAMLRTPPHILVTTPESLYLLLTARRSREMLRTVRTVIVDEIHAVLESRRGAHLALSLERLEHVAGRPIQRIGLSATMEPIAEVGDWLVGETALRRYGATALGGSDAIPIARPAQPAPAVINAGHRRALDLGLELPKSPLEAVMSGEVWEEVYGRLTELIEAHRTTLVFVNTRRLAERVARQLAERLGEDAVTAHHGSLSKESRLDAEERLKTGKLRALVATASLELGIDIGHVDLVCQLGTPRRISTFLQRVGRSGHTVHGTPKGRLFPLTRDELVECTALLRSVEEGKLDRIVIREKPLDVLSQQLVAETAAEDWSVDELFELVRRAHPYRQLDRAEFDEVVAMLTRGFETRRGRRGALLHHDTVHGRLRGRRGARHDGDHVGRRDPGQRGLPGGAGAGGHVHRDGERGLRGREHGGRHLPARQHVLADPAGAARRGAGGRRPRPAALDSILVRRGTGAQRGTLGGGGGAAGGDGRGGSGERRPERGQASNDGRLERADRRRTLPPISSPTTSPKPSACSAPSRRRTR